MAVRDDQKELQQRVDELEGELASLDARFAAKQASARDPLEERLAATTREVAALSEEVQALAEQQHALEQEALAATLGAG